MWQFVYECHILDGLFQEWVWKWRSEVTKISSLFFFKVERLSWRLHGFNDSVGFHYRMIQSCLLQTQSLLPLLVHSFPDISSKRCKLPVQLSRLSRNRNRKKEVMEIRNWFDHCSWGDGHSFISLSQREREREISIRKSKQWKQKCRHSMCRVYHCVYLPSQLAWQRWRRKL